VGTVLAQRLGVGLRDTDADIAAAAGQPVADIFVDHGEQHVRVLESDAVRAALAEHDGVLCVGSGAIESADVRALLRGHRVVFLDVGIADAARRSGLDIVRPVHLGNVRAQLKRLLEARRPLYVDVATATVETDGRSIDEVADDVLAVDQPEAGADAG
jgi:shikimate kinase